MKPAMGSGTYAAALALVALGGALLPGAAAGSTIPVAGQSSGGIYLITDEALLPADTDGARDVYRRAGGALSLETLGETKCQPGCGNGAHDVQTSFGLPLLEPEGFVFGTAESLVAGDTDGSVDVYERVGSSLAQVSVGPNGFNGPDDAEFFRASPDGSTVLFTTREQLVAEDTDAAEDVYSWSAGTTTLVSTEPQGGNGEFDAVPRASSKDCSVVLFTTAERLVGADTDNSVDLYRRDGTSTTQVSRGGTAAAPASFNGPYDVDPFVVTASDGSRTMFSTDEELNAAEEDSVKDVYSRLGETTTLVSSWTIFVGYQEFLPAYLEAANPDINLTVFSTPEKLDEVDTDHSTDIYERFGGATELVSRAPPGYPQSTYNGPFTPVFRHYQPGTNGIFFTTDEKLVAADTDNSVDIYERVGGTTYLISRGPKGFNGEFVPTLRQVSPDGSRAFFTTAEQMDNADTDNSVDLYERVVDERTVLRSSGEINGNGPFDVTTLGGSNRVLFVTSEQLVPGDADSAPDLYAEKEGRTSLISTAAPDPPGPTLEALSPAPPANENHPVVRGSAEPQSQVEVFSDPQCSGEPLAGGPAAAFASPGFTVTVPDDATTTLYAESTDANGNTGPCSSGLAYVEDSTAQPPSLTAIDPAGPANDGSPRVRGSAESGATVRIFADPLCGGAPLAEGSQAELAAGGISVAAPENQTTRFYGTIVDRAGNVSACSSASPDYIEDSRPPETAIYGGPRHSTREKRSVFYLEANEPATFSCRVDNRRPVPCGSPYRTPGLRFGHTHRLAVTATDLSGNTDPTPATRSFKVLRRLPRHRR
jgi:hypothetical protein